MKTATHGGLRSATGGFLLAVGLAGVSGCGGADSPPPLAGAPSVPEPTRGYILISIDTLRADRLGTYGYDRPTSPTIDALAARGVVFERAVAQYPSTLTSHMSIFTGLYPQEHQVLPPSTVLAETIATLPELFQKAGFRTAGHTEGGFVAGGYGFRRGFDEFSDTAYRSDTDVERTFGRGLEFLRSLAGQESFFLFLHTYSVHDPYDPPESYQQLFWPGEPPAGAFASSGENLRDVNAGERTIDAETVAYFSSMYDASVRYLDDVLGGFLADLEAIGLSDQVTLIVTSDHGEEFREHGRLAHTQIYPETLLVPLIIVHPQQPGPRRIAQVVETVDLLPTLLESAGLPVPTDVSGRSLAGLLGGGAAESEAPSQGYAEVFDVEFVRTVVAQDREERFQLVMVEPEWDPVGPWIRDRVTFDVEGRTLRFEGQSFHDPRVVRMELEGEPLGELTIPPQWTKFEIDLPQTSAVHRLTLSADGCVVPATVSDSQDGRCLAFQVRNFRPRRFELYDLVADPGARHDLFELRPELRRRLAGRLLGRKWNPRGEVGELGLTESDEETLKALGYLD